MRDILLSLASRESLSWAGFVILAFGLLGEVGVFTIPAKKRAWHNFLGFSFAAVVLIGYVIGHIGDDAISARFEARALKAESKLAARSLSDAEVAEIAASLKQFSQQEFAIASYGGEAASLAVRLKRLLESAGWKWFEPQSQILPLPGTVGIQVWAYSEGSGRDAARTLVKALNDKSIDAMLLPAEKAQSSPDNKIEIIVGAKF